MANNETYNGWTNYPTWACNLWLDNDEYLYSLKVEIAENASDVYSLAEEYKMLIQEIQPENCYSGLYGDLLGYAIDSINFYEIAECAWEDYHNEEEEEEEEDEE